LAAVAGLRARENGEITLHLIPLAWTPLGFVIGENPADVALPLGGLFDWIDRTFSAEDEHAFVASMRDLELLARVGWSSTLPAKFDERNVLNLEDLPEDLADAILRPSGILVQCAACRRLCERDDFVWKERRLCAWDYHAQVFGRRGPWHEGPYEERHFATLPSCAYVVPELLSDLRVEVLLTIGSLPEPAILTIVNGVVESDSAHAHMGVMTTSGYTVLREA